MLRLKKCQNRTFYRFIKFDSCSYFVCNFLMMMKTMLPIIPGLILLKPPMTIALLDIGCPPKGSEMALCSTTPKTLWELGMRMTLTTAAPFFSNDLMLLATGFRYHEPLCFGQPEPPYGFICILWDTHSPIRHYTQHMHGRTMFFSSGFS